MVFGKLFGGGKKDDDSAATPREEPAGWFSTLDPVWQEILRELDKHPSMKAPRGLIVKHLYKREIDEARRYLQAIVLPRLSAAEAERLKHAGSHQAWATLSDLRAAGIVRDVDTLPKDELGIGRFGAGPDNYATLHFTGEGHLLTVAPTGAGKGQRYIIPNLLEYEGRSWCSTPRAKTTRPRHGGGSSMAASSSGHRSRTIPTATTPSTRSPIGMTRACWRS